MCSHDSNLDHLSTKDDNLHAIPKCSNLEDQQPVAIQQQTKLVISRKVLKVSVRGLSAGEVLKDDTGEDGCKTPREVISNQCDDRNKSKCPPAPRKPKSKKRKLEERNDNVVSVKVSHSEVEFLLFAQGFAGCGAKIMKKVRTQK